MPVKQDQQEKPPNIFRAALIDIAAALLPGHARVSFSNATGVSNFVAVVGMAIGWMCPVLQTVTSQIHDVDALVQEAEEMKRVNAEGNEVVAQLQLYSTIIKELDLFLFLGKVKRVVEMTGKDPQCVVRELTNTLKCV